MTITRRDIFKVGALGGAAAFLPWERVGSTAVLATRMPPSAMPAKFTLPFRRPPELAPSGTTSYQCPDGIVRSYPLYNVSQQFTVNEIMPGFQTPVFAYNGVVPGPTIRVNRDQPVMVRQKNRLHLAPEPPYADSPMPAPYTTDPLKRTTSTHLHGSASLPQFDGYASDTTPPGYMKDYVYPNGQEARTLWYHDHAVHHTSQNAYSGLAGLYIIHDEHELNAGIPTMADPATWAYDVPLVIRDAMFDVAGRLIYNDNDQSGVYGDVPLVNGVPWPVMDVEPRLYRFRILNGAVSRSWKWQLWDGAAAVPMRIVGTDAGLVPQVRRVKSFRHAMAERYEVLIDFTNFKGAKLTLRNLLPKNNINYAGIEQVMQFRVSREAPTNTLRNRVPADWAARVPAAECMTWTEAGLLAQGVTQRQFRFKRSGGQWTINDKTWKEVLDSQFNKTLAEVPQDAVEIWDLVNTSGGWFHPVHIHLVDFQVLSRNGSALKVLPHEKGAKDVVYVGEEERVRVAMRFAGPATEGWFAPRGRYMMHCHNLVHEDHDMMTQFQVGTTDADCDPIGAAPASFDPPLPL